MNLLFKFETRLRAAFGLAVLVFVAIAASAWYAAHELRQAAAGVAHSYEVIDTLTKIKSGSLLIELSTQNYRLANDPAHLIARDAEIAAREIALRRLKELTADNPRQQQRWTQLRATADERLAISRRIELLRKTEGAAAAQAYATAAPLRQTRERLFATLQEMDDEEDHLLQERSAEQAQVRGFRTALTAITALLLAALLAATYLMIRRQLAQRARVEAMLWESEESLATTLNSIGDGVMATDTNGCITRMNPVAECLTGWLLAQARGRPVAEVFHIINEQTRAPAEVPVAKVLATGALQGLANHTLLIARDGTEWPVADSAAPIRNAAGQVNGVVLVFRDVTAERQAERIIREQNELLEQRVRERTAQLRASEAQLQTVFENLAEGIVVSDLAGQVLQFNRAAIEMFGFASPKEYLRQLPEFADTLELSTLDGTILPLGQWPLARILRGETLRNMEISTHHVRDGWRKIFSYGGSLVRDANGQSLLAVVTLHDITERKHAEQQRSAEHAVLEGIGAGRPLAEILDTITHNVEALSPGTLCSILLLDQDGVHVRHGAAPSLPEAYSRAIDGLLIGPKVGSCGTAAYRNEQVIVTDIATDPLWADYAPLALQHGLRACWSTPVRSTAGKVLGTFALYDREPRVPKQRDLKLIERWTRLTGIAIERRRDEQAIRELNQNLERRVAERTQQLEEANRAKSDFLANMSHELRTPLNSIIGFSEMLKDGVLGELDEKQCGFVGDIFTAGTHLLSLINDILDLSKVEAGMLELDAAAVDVAALLQASLMVIREKAMAHGIRLDTQLDPALGSMLADERKLKQIAYNLLSNAVKFSAEGGTVTLLARRCARADVRADATRPARLLPLPPGDDGEFIEIAVEDSGAGIAEADLAKLFEPFTQVDSSLERRHAGTGLGLALVRRLAELHGGTVSVASRPGAGSRFSVWLPYREAAAGPAQTIPASAVASAPSATPAVPLALVIEDDDSMAELIAAELRDQGYQVMRASTAEEGLVRAAKSRPQLITLDIFLPEMDGWEFMRRLKADAALADIPVVIISISQDRDHGLALGARRVLQKPFAREDLVAALADLLDRGAEGAAARVLVVDDNVKAVELVAQALEAGGYSVLRAYGGAEAIDVARAPARPGDPRPDDARGERLRGGAGAARRRANRGHPDPAAHGQGFERRRSRPARWRGARGLAKIELQQDGAAGRAAPRAAQADRELREHDGKNSGRSRRHRRGKPMKHAWIPATAALISAIRAGRLSLRARLVGLIVLASAPMLAILFYSAADRHEETTRMARADLQYLAAQANDRLLQAVHASGHLLYALSQSRAVVTADPAECERVFAPLVTKDARYAAFLLTNAQGQALCHSDPLAKLASYADRAYFRQARDTGRFAVGEPVVGRVTRKPLLGLAQPLLNAQGQFIGAIVSGLDLNWFGRQFDQSRADLNIIFTIWSEDGTILYRYPDADKWTGQRLPDAAITRAVLSWRGKDIVMQAAGLTGVDTLYALTGTENALGHRLVISAGVARDELFAESDRVFVKTLTYFAVVFLLALAAAWGVAEYAIRRRVVALVNVSDRLAAGELSARSGLAAGTDEFGQLGASFDRMATALQHKVEEVRLGAEELARSNRTLRVLSECNQALVHASDEPQLLQVICESIVRFGGYRFAWVGYAGDDAAKNVRPVACAQDFAPDPQALQVSWADETSGHNPTGSAIRSGEVFVSNDITSDARVQAWRDVALAQGFAACIGLPIMVEERCIGALTICADERGAFHQAELPLLRELAADLSYGITALRGRGKRERAEQEIRALNQSLEQRVAERTVQLEDANRAKSDFLANMSHELRTPLNSIIGFSEMLKDGVLGELDEKQCGFVGDIFTAGTHLLSLINDILDLSKVEAGMLELELDAGAVDVAALLQASLMVIREKAMAHGIRLDTRLDPALGSMLADERKLKQIVYNLLSNAVKFTPAGGAVTLLARRCARAAVSFDAAMPARLLPLPPGDDDEFIEIAVEDNGMGIAEPDLQKLYQPFMQVDSSIARRHGGTGLGLSLVRRLAELHGGTVGVASRPGIGSRFCVWLPWRCAADLAQPAPATHSPAQARPAMPLALVVEDDDRMAELIALQLRAEGFRMIRAATAEEGLVRAAKSRPDLITLDIFLPNMDGWEFMQRMRAEPKLAQTPVVIISSSQAVGHGLALGARRVLQKPFVREELAAVLAGLVPARPDGDAPCVLVVDDNAETVELEAAMLQAEDYRVLRAYGGAQAIEVAQRELPDLVILDLMMPEVSGFEVARALRESERTARTPIVILSAKDLSAEERVRLHRDVSAILAKADFNRSALLAELRRALPRQAGH